MSIALTKAQEYQKKYRQLHPDYWKNWYKTHPNHKQYDHVKYRLLIISRLGGKCIHCGITDQRVLQIDHINGHGREEFRKYKGNPDAFYRSIFELSDNDLEENYQILCANCNWIKKYERNENRSWKQINAR